MLKEATIYERKIVNAFIEKDKNIIFHIGNNSLNFKRAKTSGGMTMATAVSIVNAIDF